MDTNRHKSAALPPLKAAAAAAATASASKPTDETNTKRSPASVSASAPTTAASARARTVAGAAPTGVSSRTKPLAPAAATPTTTSARRSAQSRFMNDDEKRPSDARPAVRSSTSASAASASSTRTSKRTAATRTSTSSTVAPVSTRPARTTGPETATKPRVTTTPISIKSAATPTADAGKEAALPSAAGSPSLAEASLSTSKNGTAEHSSEIDAFAGNDVKTQGASALILQAVSPRKLEIRSEKSAATLARSRAGSSDNGRGQHRLTGNATEHERERRQPPKLLGHHARAQSEGLQRLSAEPARLKTDIMRLEEGRNEGPSSSADDELNRRHAAELDALRAAHSSALEALRESLTAELHSVKLELDSHRHRSSQLDGVEGKIEAVQNALRDAKQSEHELQQEVKEKAQDRDQLAKVVEELEQEIDRCQSKLDEDSRLQAQEKDEIRQMTERLQGLLEEEQQRSRAAADKAEKISTELDESRERFKHELKDLHERNEQETEELRVAAADADRLREELNASHESLGQCRNSLQESTSTVKRLQENAERLENQQHEHHIEMEMLRGQLSQAQEAEIGLRATREREESDKEQFERGTEQDMEVVREQLSKLERELSDNVSTITRLQNESRMQHQQTQELRDQREVERSHQFMTIQKVEAKLQQAESRIEEVTAQAAREREASSSLWEELQSKIARAQQEHEDTRRAAKESEEAMTRQLALRQRDLDVAHSAVESNRQDQNSQRKALEEMGMKVQSAEKATAESANVIERLQSEAQMLQQELHNEKGLRSEDQQELRRLRERCQSLEEDVQGAIAQKIQISEEQQFTMQARMDDLSDSLARAREREAVAVNARARTEIELRESRESVLRLQESAAEHIERVAHFEALDIEWRAKMSRMLERHAEELEQVRAEGLLQQERGLASAHEKCEALLADKLNLEKQLGETYMQHNRELEEEEQKHMTSYRELQTKYRQLQSALRDREAGEAANSGKHEDLLKVISTMRTEHERTLTELQRIEQQSQQSELVRASLQSSLEELKMEHSRAVQEMANEHARRMQEIGDAHNRELEDREKIAADQASAAAMATTKEQHERVVAALMEDNQQKMQQLSDSIAEVEAAAIREAGIAAEEQAREHDSAVRALKEQHETATSALQAEVAELRRQCHVQMIESNRPHCASVDTPESNAGLSHIFVNHEAEPDIEQYGRQLDHSYSREFQAAPREATSGFSRRGSGTSSIAASLIYEDDPFKSPIDGHRASSFARHAAEVRDSEDGYGSVLEGTLESLRIQTEQLLNINNDFLAEQRRWSGRLGLVATRVSNW